MDDKLMGAIIAGILSGVISPLVLSWLQHRVIWKSQKQLEIKFVIFQDAVRALSLWATDALDIHLQSNKASHNGLTRVTEARPETWELIEKSRGLVQAFFSSETFAAYDEALRANISLQSIPNEEFDQKRTKAILLMATELGIYRPTCSGNSR